MNITNLMNFKMELTLLSVVVKILFLINMFALINVKFYSVFKVTPALKLMSYCKSYSYNVNVCLLNFEIFQFHIYLEILCKGNI